MLDELSFGGGGIRATRRPRGWLSLGPPTRSHDAVVVLAVSCVMRRCISAHRARRRFARRLGADVSGEGISGIATPRKGPCVTARSAVFQRWDTGVLSFFRFLVSKLAPPQSRVTIRLFLRKPKTRFRRRRDFSTAWDSRRCFTPAQSFGQACTDVCKSPSRAHRCVVVFFPSSFHSFLAASRGTRETDARFSRPLCISAHAVNTGTTSASRARANLHPIYTYIDDVTCSRLKVAVCKRHRRHFTARLLSRTTPQQRGVLGAFRDVVSSVYTVRFFVGRSWHGVFFPPCGSQLSLVAISVGTFLLRFGIKKRTTAHCLCTHCFYFLPLDLHVALE